MAKPIILVTGADLAPAAVQLLRDYELVYAGRTPTEDDIVALCEVYDPVAIIVRYGRITPRVIAAGKSLRVISKHGTGIDTIDSGAAAARGIAVRAAAGANATAVAEHTLALMLAAAKSVVPLHGRMLEGQWDKATHKSMELAGRTLGLVGLGAIGAKVAGYGVALGMTVIAHDPFAKSPPAGVELASLADVFARSDVVSLHCPLTESNRGMINAATLATMRDGAILINTARGGLVDEVALIAALRSGKLRAAGLDSFVVEPLADVARFAGLPNLILSPHIGGVSHEAYVRMGVDAARNILAVLAEPQKVVS